MSDQPYVVIESIVTPRRLAGVRAIVKPGRVGAVFGQFLDQVYAAARSGAVTLDGQNVFIYQPRSDGDLTVDFCVGATQPFGAAGAVVEMTTPSGVAASTTHWGDYALLSGANSAILTWCRTNGRTLAGPSWEVYGHWSDDPTKVKTDVYYLLRDASAAI